MATSSQFTGVRATYKMANGGQTAIRRLMLSMVEVPQGDTVKYRSCYFDPAVNSAAKPIDPPTGYTDSSAIAGNYSGKIAGESNATGFGIFPCYWTNDTTPNPQRGTGQAGGRFWDINDSGLSAGTWVDGNGVQTGFVFTGSATAPMLTGTSYTGAAARAVNKDGLVGGQLFGANGNPPAIWAKDEQSGTYPILVDLSTVSDWSPYSNRAGYIVGITDPVSGDSAGPYAVGYVLPGTEPETNPGVPFIYSMGSGTIKFVGSLYGEPLQVGNSTYSTDDIVVSFVGNSPRPYVWRGSPNKAVANNGVASDVWAYFVPDVHTYDTSLDQSVSGISSAGQFGGAYIDSQKQVWVTLAQTAWNYVEPGLSGQKISVPTGTVLGGSTAGLLGVDGKYMTIQKGTVAANGDPEVVVIVEERLNSNLLSQSNLEFDVLTTLRKETSSGITASFDLRDWTQSNKWDSAGSPLVLNPFMQTPKNTFTIADPSNDPHVDTSHENKMQARIAFRLTGPSAIMFWVVGVEQLRILVKG